MQIDRSQLQIKIGDYATGPSTALPNSRWLAHAQNYRRAASARMIPLDKVGLEHRMPNQDYLVSRKIDGEFTLLVFDQGQAVTINPGGTVRVGLPFLEEAAALLRAAGCDKATLLAGELYVERKDDRRPRVHDVTRMARNPESLEHLQQLKFAVFDVVLWDGEEALPAYGQVWERIAAALAEGRLVHPVETVHLNKTRAILAQFEAWVEGEGAEGIVARSDAAGIFKVKLRHTLDVVAVGFAEGIDDRSGLLHDILLAVVRSDGSFQIVGRVGGGFTDEQRRDFLSDLQDLAVESDYAEVNSDRVAYQMIRPERVVEISCLDLIAQTTRGGAINRMVIRWDESAGKWRTERRLPLASILSPEFIRFREDKSASPGETGLTQLTEIVEIEGTEKTLEDLQLPRSEMLRRVVYTKELKGNTMVRKLVLWKSNKEVRSDIHPAYVLHYTDFSPNRKSPLEREIRVSQSREQMDRFWEELSEKAFVRGWKEVTGTAP